MNTEHDWYAKRLNDPTLLDRSLTADNGNGGMALLVPCGGSRVSGHTAFWTTGARDAAIRLMEAHGGFPDIHDFGFPWSPDELLFIEWGEPIEDLLSPWQICEDNGQAPDFTWNELLASEHRNGELLGYSTEAIDQYIEHLNHLYA